MVSDNDLLRTSLRFSGVDAFIVYPVVVSIDTEDSARYTMQGVVVPYAVAKSRGRDMLAPRKLPTVLTEDEQSRPLKQPNLRYPTGERNRTLLPLMLNTGLRLTEVMALKWRDLDLITGKLMVREGGQGSWSAKRGLLACSLVLR